MRRVWLAALVLLSSAPALAAPSAAKPPAYVTRGQEAQKKYEEYTKRLAGAYEMLKSALKAEAPDLFAKLSPAPPRPVPYGYQIVPRLTRDAAPSERRDPPRATSTPYSWQRTSDYIDSELPKIEEIEEQLRASKKVKPGERRSVYEKLVGDYRTLEDNQKLLDVHLQYNWFWQKTIDEDKPRFQRLTKLHDMVLTHQELSDALNSTNDADFHRHLLQVQLPGVEHNKPRVEIEPELRALEKKLSRLIHSQNENVHPASYLHLSHPKPNVWKVEVPVCTDITDESFLATAKREIERLWSLEERENTYRLRIDFRRIPARKLYRGARPPARGSHIDVKAHAARFPRDCGILTTGTNSTYAIPGAYIALGPNPISYNVLAHEFGHLLGFIDGYFRGYRDLGDQGYEVLEVVPDPEDIMCTPGVGHVMPYHYEKLFRKADAKKPQ